MLGKVVRRCWVWFCLFWVALWGLTEQAVALSSIGEFSNQVLGPLATFNHFVFVVSYILGAGFLAGAVARYMEFRRNPIQTRLSSVVFIFLLGLTLVFLPLIASYSPAVTSVKESQRAVSHQIPDVQSAR